MRTRPRLAAILCSALTLAAADGAARAEAPWARPFADAAAVARAAAKATAPADSDAVVLLEEGHYVFDADGRSTYTYRQVARVLRQAAVDEWSSWSVGWEPWHEERPHLRGRVIAPDGSVRALDPATIEERSVGGGSADVYGDDKLLRAPLPGVAAGAVVEVEIVTRERAPRFDAGVVRRFYFGKLVPSERVRLVVDVPRSLKLSYTTTALPGFAPRRTVVDGRVRWLFERGPTPALPPPEDGAPPSWPTVAFATGASWARVAARYAQIVDEAIARGNVPKPTAAAHPSAAERAAIAARLLARVHRDVRYTAVEFGASSIVPSPPAQTLARRFGDCKDQATLLVALLRAAGVPASVALLDTVGESDADPRLPGLDFNHAIVYVPGAPALGPALWIDPTSPFARAGELPLDDQGRHALVADARTTKLIETPAPRARDNLLSEERTFALAEEGHARVVEVTHVGGAFEREYRRYQSEVDPRKDREAMERYVAHTYRDAKLDKIVYGDPSDLGHAFDVTIEASDSGRGLTAVDHAEVGVFPAGLLHWLPDTLREKPKDGKPRRSGYVLTRPQRIEQHIHILAPPGYVAAKLPEPQRIPVGPWHLDVRFSPGRNGGVEGLLSFETDKTTLDAKEVDAIRDAVADLDGRDGITVTLPSVAETALQAGRLREGIAELERLRALHPKEALHAMRLADALTRAGLGDAARAAARQAVALEPRNADAWLTLGQVLACDPLGRRQWHGSDPAGVEAALRKAKALDPKNVEARFELAVRLERDADGVRYSPRARLAEAAAEYRAIAKELGSHAADENLEVLLMRMGRVDEVKAQAATMPASTRRDAIVVAAVAMRDGAPAAITEAQARAADARRRDEIVSTAAATLVLLRHYAEAAALARRLDSGTANPLLTSQAALLAKVPRRETVSLPDDAIGAVRRMFIAAVGPDPRALGKLLLDEGWPRGNTVEQGWFMLQRMLARVNLPADVFADLAASSALPMTAQGDARWGWRVRLQAALGKRSDIYVVRTPAGLRILGEDAPARLAERALAALARNDVEAARHWLLWLREGAHVDDGAAELEQIDEHADRAAIEAAAAILTAWSPAAARALPLLARCAASGPAERRAHCADARVLALAVSGRSAEALQAAEARIAAEPDRPMNQIVHAALLADVGRRADSERALDQLRRRWPTDPRIDETAARIALRYDRCADVRRAEQRLIDSGHVDPMGRNNYAWCAAVLGAVGDGDVEQARRAVDETNHDDPSALNTLAMLLAERGQLDAARDALRERVLPGRDLDDDDWLVLGRIAEQVGLRDAARRAYAAITRPARPRTQDAWSIAQRRLAALPRD